VQTRRYQGKLTRTCRGARHPRRHRCLRHSRPAARHRGPRAPITACATPAPPGYLDLACRSRRGFSPFVARPIKQVCHPCCQIASAVYFPRPNGFTRQCSLSSPTRL
jgi:hypothetical protein